MTHFDPIAKICEQMYRKNNLPSTPGAIAQIIDTINLDSALSENISDLVRLISSDFTMTQKILRLANSPMYSTFSKNGVESVTAAVEILGSDVLGYLALSTTVLKQQNIESTSPCSTELSKTLLSTQLARRLSNVGEQIAVEALLFNSGKLMSAFYLEPEFLRIEKLVEDGDMSETDAAKHVLGMTFEQIGEALSQKWNFPERLVNAAKKEGAYKDLIQFSVDASALILDGNQNGLEELIKKSADVVDKPVEFLQHAAHAARAEFKNNITARTGGINKVRDEVTKLLQEAKARFEFDRIIFFVKTRDGTRYHVYTAAGIDITNEFGFNAKFEPSVFHIAIIKNTDVLIADAQRPETQTGIPAWHKQLLSDAHAFLIMTLSNQGLIYCDWVAARHVSDEELNEIKKLKSAVMELFS